MSSWINSFRPNDQIARLRSLQTAARSIGSRLKVRNTGGRFVGLSRLTVLSPHDGNELNCFFVAKTALNWLRRREAARFRLPLLTAREVCRLAGQAVRP
jgi:hypothetical protein